MPTYSNKKEEVTRRKKLITSSVYISKNSFSPSSNLPVSFERLSPFLDVPRGYAGTDTKRRGNRCRLFLCGSSAVLLGKMRRTPF